MRCSTSAGRVALLASLLAGCAAVNLPPAGQLDVRHAALVERAGGTVLALALDCRLSGPMRDALDHGIPVTFVVTVQAGRGLGGARASERVEMRYFPLSRRYRLLLPDTAESRSFAVASALVAALGAVSLPLPPEFATLPDGTPLAVDVRVDPATWPGALRLPALFEPAWRLSAPTWHGQT